LSGNEVKVNFATVWVTSLPVSKYNAAEIAEAGRRPRGRNQPWRYCQCGPAGVRKGGTIGFQARKQEWQQFHPHRETFFLICESRKCKFPNFFQGSYENIQLLELLWQRLDG
jgi:hypothetical protein